jgi:tRNA (guanine26-N2/guanine27-N2)-dimethyltransferase
VESTHYCEGLARLRIGAGFFEPRSRPSRDLGVLLARSLSVSTRLRVLDLMAGCGIRALRYGLEAGAAEVWANDGDAQRLPDLRANLAPLAPAVAVRISARTAQAVLAALALRRQHRELVDLDGFGCPAALLPAAVEAVSFGGALYLASSDGRSATGHDRRAAVRRFGAAARAHPASWELALRLQIGAVARAAWAQGRGIRPLFSFSEGRTFRTALAISRLPAAAEEALLGLVAHCHGCGDQQVMSLLRLGRWQPCLCSTGAALAVSGPLWIGPLQHLPCLEALAVQAAASPVSVAPESQRLLDRLRADPGALPRCWPTALIARRLGQGPPPVADLVAALRRQGHQASASAVMSGQVRSDAPWSEVLAIASSLVASGQPVPADERAEEGEEGGRSC